MKALPSALHCQSLVAAAAGSCSCCWASSRDEATAMPIAVSAWQTARRTDRDRSANDNAAREDRRMVLVIVIVAGAGDGQRQRLLALPRDDEADGVDLAAIRICRIGSALDVVRLRVVVDEGDPLTRGNDQLLRV